MVSPGLGGWLCSGVGPLPASPWPRPGWRDGQPLRGAGWCPSRESGGLAAWAWGLQAAAAVGRVRTRGPVGQPSARPGRVTLSRGQRAPSGAGLKVAWSRQDRCRARAGEAFLEIGCERSRARAPRVAWSGRPVCPIWLASVSGTPPARRACRCPGLHSLCGSPSWGQTW